MTTYRVKTGHDQTLASLTVLDPQPDPGPMIQATRRTHAADGTVYDQARYIELHFSALDDAAAYQALLSSFGLSLNNKTAAVTVYVRNEVFNWLRMNGTAVLPEPGQSVTWGDVQSRPLNVVVLVRDLSNAAEIDLQASDDIEVSESKTVSVA